MKQGDYHDWSGTRFGRWTVLGQREVRLSPKGAPIASWWCRCDCGTEKRVQISNLRYARDASCGCMRNEALSKKMSKAPGHGATTMVLGYYRRNAQNRDLDWSLTDDEFKVLLFGACHYCGVVGSSIKVKHHDTIKCNGIDRIDSDFGYTSSNCVSCCKTCNLAKSSMTVDEFLDWVGRVARFNATALGLSVVSTA